MAVTFGQLTQQILDETFRDDSFTTAIQNAIITAIKYLEFEQIWLFEASTQLTIPAESNSVALPADFSSMESVRLLVDSTYYTPANGFQSVTTNEMEAFERTVSQPGRPACWALFGNTIRVSPWTDSSTSYVLDIKYYKNDGGVYPSAYADTSIWFADLTQDVTRYFAKAIFYRDTLQDDQNSAANQALANNMLDRLRTRNLQRQQINRLSI